MEERIAQTIRSINTLGDLAKFEANAQNRDALTEDVKEAIRARTVDLGCILISKKTGLDLTNLSPAEEKIVRAVSEYVGVMKRRGKNATRTFSQLHNLGLIKAAETAVSKSKPTQGFTILTEANLVELSYEQIILDHPEEFSPRAIWHSNRTLEHENRYTKPPVEEDSQTQIRTERLLQWFQGRSQSNNGILNSFTNAESAAAIEITNMQKSGKAFGNIQSRVDFACYICGLPPLGLTADKPFSKAWAQQKRDWAYPVKSMQAAAKSRIWSDSDFDLVFSETRQLPGLPDLLWKEEVEKHEAKVKEWAFSFESIDPQPSHKPKKSAEKSKRNPSWSRDELILALDLYLSSRNSSPTKNSPEIAELSLFLNRMRRGLGPSETKTYRNENGVYMKLMNFKSLDPDYTSDGRVGLTRGNKLEEEIWNEFADDPKGLAKTVEAIRIGMTLPSELADLEEKYRNEKPKVKERASTSIERGNIGTQLKEQTGFRCQICEALGLNPIGFLKENGDPYVEAHHVMPVSKLEVGSLAASNIMILCANHHRQIHYGGIDVKITETSFDFAIDGTEVNIPKHGL
jgi:predicted HNH restriction endonuclease